MKLPKLKDLPDWFKALPFGQRLVDEAKHQEAVRTERAALLTERRQLLAEAAALNDEEPEAAIRERVTAEILRISEVGLKDMHTAMDRRQRIESRLRRVEQRLFRTADPRLLAPDVAVRLAIYRTLEHLGTHLRGASETTIPEQIRNLEREQADASLSRSDAGLLDRLRGRRTAYEKAEIAYRAVEALREELNQLPLTANLDAEADLAALHAQLPTRCVVCDQAFADERPVPADILDQAVA